MRIMIVDDEELLRNGLKAMMERMDLPLVVAGMACDGDTALEMLAQLDPDVMLTDIRMPRMDGLQLIEQVSGCFPNVRFVVLSGYDDFDYAKRAIHLGCEDYLVKPPNYSELRDLLHAIYNRMFKEKEERLEAVRKSEVLNRSQRLIQTDLLRALLSKTTATRLAEIREQAKTIGLHLNSDHYRVVVLQFEKRCELERRYTKPEWELLKYASCNIASEVMEDGICFYDETGRLVLLLADSLSMEESVDKCLELRKNLIRYLNISMSAALSEVKPLSSIEEGNAEACRLLKLRLIRDKSVVITEEAAAAHLNDVIRFHSDKLPELFKADQIHAIGPMLKDWVQSIKTAGYSLSALERLEQELNVALIALIHNLPERVSGHQIPVSDWLNEVEKADSFTDKIEPFLRIIDLMDKQEHRGTFQNRTIEQAIAFIRTHFKGNLTLGSIAEHVNMNPAYFSVLFKKKTGQGVVEYVTDTRMEEAKRLLLHTDLKTYQLAEQAGYQDSAYFSNLFKRQTGMTPQQFRNKQHL